MLRRDYIIEAIEECMQALLRIKSLRKEHRWEDAQGAVDAECEKLVSAGAWEVAQLSETELLARLAQGQPTSVVRNRMFVLVSLFQEAGLVAIGQGRESIGRVILLRSLNLLLQISASDALGEHPAFVPRVDDLALLLANAPMPVPTSIMLMRHYESSRQFGKAEDILFSILDSSGKDEAIFALGNAFYSRILRENDQTLDAAQLPRNEAQEGLRELQRRKES